MAGSTSDSGAPDGNINADGLTPRDQLELASALQISQLQTGFSPVIRDISSSPAIRIDCSILTASLNVGGPLIKIAATDSMAAIPDFLASDLLNHGLTVSNGLPTALSQPVSRRRLAETELSEPRRKTLRQALDKRFGKAADSLEVVAIFANIPPEAVKSIVVADDLQAATFIPAAADDSRPLRSGFWLAVISAEVNETQKFLIRLD